MGATHIERVARLALDDSYGIDANQISGFGRDYEETAGILTLAPGVSACIVDALNARPERRRPLTSAGFEVARRPIERRFPVHVTAPRRGWP